MKNTAALQQENDLLREQLAVEKKNFFLKSLLSHKSDIKKA
ncbi:hypothetical protein [Zhongshania sp. BJYM1]|jgi:hypothetical protein|nr:hypothetical protein [Marortus sp. BJYM1]